MADLGLNVPVITMVTGPAYLEFTEGLGDLATEYQAQLGGTTRQNTRMRLAHGQRLRVLQGLFKAAYNSDPDYVHGSCGAAADILVDAVQRAGGKDKNKIRAALEATDVMTFYGPVKFSSNGMAQGRDLPIIQVQGGEIKVLSPPEIANAKMVKVN